MSAPAIVFLALFVAALWLTLISAAHASTAKHAADIGEHARAAKLYGRAADFGYAASGGFAASSVASLAWIFS